MQFSDRESVMLQDVRQHFSLDPKIVYFNHGSFGACPRPVFETYQAWQRELERQPVDFLDRRAQSLMAEARARLASYVGCDADDVVYFPNPTTALNMVARSLELEPGDEVLSTELEYGAMDRTWRFICQRRGARYVRMACPLQMPDFVDAFWAGVNENTRVIFLSHITSVTALTLPVKQICERAKEAGILTIVDGAHAPGQIPLDLSELDADIYSGACHKWLCAPKGSAFLYARRDIQPLLQPLVVSWGWESDEPSSSTFIDHHELQGTRDIAAFLSVPAAIDFQEKHDWSALRRVCHKLALATWENLRGLPRVEPIVSDPDTWHAQMISMAISDIEAGSLHRTLLEEHSIEVLTDTWNDSTLMRLSFQTYNTPEHAERLTQALVAILK
jgi:isopenicillin-N epimerase